MCRKGKEIKPSERFVITANGAKRKLVIKKVTLEDQTDITCMAMNIKTTSKLKIEGSPLKKHIIFSIHDP